MHVPPAERVHRALFWAEKGPSTASWGWECGADGLLETGLCGCVCAAAGCRRPTRKRESGNTDKQVSLLGSPGRAYPCVGLEMSASTPQAHVPFQRQLAKARRIPAGAGGGLFLVKRGDGL